MEVNSIDKEQHFSNFSMSKMIQLPPQNDLYCNGRICQIPQINESFSSRRSFTLTATLFDPFAIKEGEIAQVERIQIPLSKTLSEICQRAKKLYKHAIFYGRQVYFLMQEWKEGSYFAHKHPEGYSLTENYLDVANNLVKFVEIDDKLSDESRDRLLKELKEKIYANKKLNISTELRKELGKLWHQGGLYRILNDSIPYRTLAKYFGHLPTQLLFKVDDTWKSYQKSVKKWRLNSGQTDGAAGLLKITRSSTFAGALKGSPAIWAILPVISDALYHFAIQRLGGGNVQDLPAVL